MRPVLLVMDGFATFREATAVDFTGADYFALVGPTGSGKSTVIDAMTFALYGSVHRWDNSRTVALALAPTVNRGTVRFVFDVADARYVVARELRRAASGSVSVKEARLEKLRDRSGTGDAGADSEPVAAGAVQVTAAVQELLGLSFGDFCTCVVLPQGEFADFLHTEPRKRQEKLVRILGLGVYDVIAKEANTRASEQKQRAEALTAQLVRYADATEDAERSATERLAALEALGERVTAAVPELLAAGTELTAANATVARLREERDRLAALTVPDGVADLDARRAAASDEATAAAGRAAAAERADTDAREQVAAAPARGPLEQVRRRHAESARLAAELPLAEERHAKVRSAYTAAEAAAVSAAEAVTAARTVRDSRVTALGEARAAVTRVAAERDSLRAVTIPSGLDVLDRRRSDAVAALDEAGTALTRAEDADATARAALAGAPDRGPLERARRDHHDLAAALDEQAAAEHRVTETAAAAAAAAEQVAAARRTVEDAQRARTAAQRADLAAALRPSLVAGEPCPVCRQAVPAGFDAAAAPEPAAGSAGTGHTHAGEATEPTVVAAVESAAVESAAVESAAVVAAEQAVAEAEAAHERARRAESAAAAGVAAATAERDRATTTVDRLRAALADAPPTAGAVDAALADLDALTVAARTADEAARTARRRRDAAAAEAQAVRSEAASAAAALRAARDPLVPLGAPAVDSEDVPAGWAALVSWARAGASDRETGLRAARAAEADAAERAGAAERDLTEASALAERRRREETGAARTEQDAGNAVAQVRTGLADLRAALAGAPTDAGAAAELDRLAALEAAAKAADAELRAARAAQRTADDVAAALLREVHAAWGALRAARDPLVPLGVPVVREEALLTAWTELTGWAGREAEDRDGRLAEASRAAEAATAAGERATRLLAEDLAAHEVAAAAPLSSTAPPAVATAVERARGALNRVVERRAQVAALEAERAEAESAQQVARLLGQSLRSDGFPRWLVASALDALVADASRSLAELSGGQFELTHSGGEFLVVDHADADAQRPVKTLSGGETFQASLALALALSAQMSALAAHGAARLESIFLDEGFGTLDEANLETVASTLETLATRGDRMVGVITHVPALAERVPVRFAVRRDQQSSSVTRESL